MLCFKLYGEIIYKFVYKIIMQYLFVFGRSFQGHTGGVEHVSFDGNAVISASTDL